MVKYSRACSKAEAALAIKTGFQVEFCQMRSFFPFTLQPPGQVEMVDDVKKQNVTFSGSVLLEQGLADLKMDRLFLLFGNEGIGSLLHPVMQEFVAAALCTRTTRRIIQLRSLRKTEDQPGFQGRQQVLIDSPRFRLR